MSDIGQPNGSPGDRLSILRRVGRKRREFWRSLCGPAVDGRRCGGRRSRPLREVCGIASGHGDACVSSKSFSRFSVPSVRRSSKAAALRQPFGSWRREGRCAKSRVGHLFHSICTVGLNETIGRFSRQMARLSRGRVPARGGTAVKIVTTRLRRVSDSRWCAAFALSLLISDILAAAVSGL